MFYLTYDVVSTSMQRQTDLETTSCVYKEGDLILCHQQSLDFCGLHPNPRDLWNLIPLKYINYLHKVVLLWFHCFPWKRYNFNWLKDIFCEYYIKRMKELLSWLLYPIGCGPTTKVFYILQIYMISNRDKHKIWFIFLSSHLRISE